MQGKIKVYSSDQQDMPAELLALTNQNDGGRGYRPRQDRPPSSSGPRKDMKPPTPNEFRPGGDRRRLREQDDSVIQVLSGDSRDDAEGTFLGNFREISVKILMNRIAAFESSF